MILVDSSVWIDVLAERASANLLRFEAAMRRDALTVGDLIAVEVLQGFRHETRLRLAESALAQFDMVTLCGPEIASKAAANYRALRRRGITVRGTIDVIIATWCIENRTALLHDDRDFDVFERQLGLICAR